MIRGVCYCGPVKVPVIMNWSADHQQANVCVDRLMKMAAEFTPASGQLWTGEMSVKRLTYVHCVTQQLCQVTYLPNADLEAVSTVLVNLLSEIESVESAGEMALGENGQTVAPLVLPVDLVLNVC